MEDRNRSSRSKESLESFLRDGGFQFGQDAQTRHSTFVFRRLLDRLFQGGLGLQLKGGMALRMRTQAARYTTDLDLTSEELSLLEMRDLIEAQTKIDLDDFLNFEILKFEALPIVDTQPSREGARVSLAYSWGATAHSTRVNIDLVHDKTPFAVDLPSAGIMEPPAGLPVSQIKLYALPHQIAQKVCACLENHNGHPASRAKDLVDLAIIAISFTVERAELVEALAFEFAHRNLAMPSVFAPNASLIKSYSKEKKRLGQISLPVSGEQAVALVNDLLLLEGFVDLGSRWDPATAVWQLECSPKGLCQIPSNDQS